MYLQYPVFGSRTKEVQRMRNHKANQYMYLRVQRNLKNAKTYTKKANCIFDTKESRG